MLSKKLELIDENKSPLFRIMSVYNDSAANKAFGNNICAFHLGNGIVISVAHNLRQFDNLPTTISNNFFHTELDPKIQASQKSIFSNIYPIQAGSSSRFANGVTQANAPGFINILNQARVDRSYSTLYRTACCKPFLLTTFRNNAFCGQSLLNSLFPIQHIFPEPGLNRHTFLIELELINSFDEEDLAVYKIVNTRPEIIAALPSIKPDYNLYDTGTPDYYCLQGAPYDNLGRIINEARIEGLLDNFAQETNLLGNINRYEGIRYLVKGYFRFGSSGAPYVLYNRDEECFKANAVQSQASFIQMMINGQMDGNIQYVNGIATPIKLIQERLEQLTS